MAKRKWPEGYSFCVVRYEGERGEEGRSWFDVKGVGTDCPRYTYQSEVEAEEAAAAALIKFPEANGAQIYHDYERWIAPQERGQVGYWEEAFEWVGDVYP